VLGERLYSLKGRRGQSEWIISDKMPQTLTFFLTKRVVQFGKLWTRIEVTAVIGFSPVPFFRRAGSAGFAA
jgi:hypothetical protein